MQHLDTDTEKASSSVVKGFLFTPNCLWLQWKLSDRWFISWAVYQVTGPLRSAPLLAAALSARSSVLDFSVKAEFHLEQSVSGPDGAEQLFKERIEVTVSWIEGWADRATSPYLLLSVWVWMSVCVSVNECVCVCVCVCVIPSAVYKPYNDDAIRIHERIITTRTHTLCITFWVWSKLNLPGSLLTLRITDWDHPSIITHYSNQSHPSC